jgi:RNA polymerase sigma-70 factor (ECF subfamily)
VVLSRLARRRRPGLPAGGGGAPAPAPLRDTDLDDDLVLVERLRSGDEAAFTTLVDRYHRSLVRLARAYVPTDAVAEEVAQEAWIGMLRGLDRFEGRSSLRTWLFRILVNQAKTHGARERRLSPAESLSEPSVDPDRFLPAGVPGAGGWSRPPHPWAGADERLLATETFEVVRRAIDMLPPMQRDVITLRDVWGLGSAEVCELLELTEGNQRVLLHRARSRVRLALERYMEEAP